MSSTHSKYPYNTQKPALFANLASIILLASLFLFGCDQHTPSNSITAPHIKASLIADQTSLSPGSNFTLGVIFNPEPGWHIYWKNPGDSGLAPHFNWGSTSEKITVHPPLWPYPKRFSNGPLVNFGYSDVLIPFPASIKGDSILKPITISVKIEWLVCKDECIPGEATLSLELPVKAEAASVTPQSDLKLFERAYSDIPQPLERVSLAVEERDNQVTIALIPLDQQLILPSELLFFPEERRIFSLAKDPIITRDGSVLRITLERDLTNRAPIDRIRGVLVSPSRWPISGNPIAVSIDTDPKAGESTLSDPLLKTASSDSSGNDGSPLNTYTTTFIIPLLASFLGGVLLNFMPCVFPILSIKVLSFINYAQKDGRAAKIHGIAFTLGVLVSFWILAAIIISVRLGGTELGWGFQLQSPTFVAALIIVFITLSLILLSGATLGLTLQRWAGRWRLSGDYLGSFASGILATAVATPCTAPFMSTALAATLTLPPTESAAIFTALGLGMSAPYLVLSFRPHLLKILPKPGEWMESFRQLMAFPLIASSVWLIRVFIRQLGMEPPALELIIDLLWGILAIVFAFWLLYRGRQSDQKVSTIALKIVALIVIALGVYTAIPTGGELNKLDEARAKRSSEIAITTDSHGLLWESYSEARLAKILAQGRNVLLDFTAEWCITCKVNSMVVFGSKEVRDLLVRKDVTLMRGDWTSKDSTITAALNRYGRNGVPLNVILSGPETSPVEVLPNVLTPGIVVAALEKLPGRGAHDDLDPLN